MLYIIVSVLGLIIRQVLLPNPFEAFSDKAIVLSWVFGGIIQASAYGLVGLVYAKGEDPAFGKALNILANILLTLLIWGLCYLIKYWWATLIGVGVLLFGGVIAVLIIRYRNKKKYNGKQ